MHPIKVRTEELLTRHEEEVLIKKDLINNALKSQIKDINYRLENRRFLKGSPKNPPPMVKHNSLFLGKFKFFYEFFQLFPNFRY